MGSPKRAKKKKAPVVIPLTVAMKKMAKLTKERGSAAALAEEFEVSRGQISHFASGKRKPRKIEIRLGFQKLGIELTDWEKLA